MNDFLKYLRFSLDYCPEELITENNKNVLLNLAANLPDTFARFLFGYEKGLLDGNGEMDMSISVNNRNPVHNFGSCFNHCGIKRFTETYSQWQMLKDLSDEWTKPDSLLARYLEMVALEFDFGKIKENDFIPSVFLGIESIPYLSNPHYQTELFERTKVFISSMEILSGYSLDKNIIGHLDEITKKSVNLFHLFQAGLMLSRKNSPVRICIRKLDDPNYVIGLSENLLDGKFLPGIKYIINNYGYFFDKFVISLNISESGIEKASVECSYDAKKQPSAEKRWKEMFDALCSDGLCTKEIADALLNYPAKVMVLPDLKENSNKEFPQHYVQGLHHVKFTPAAEGSLTAKAYVWSGFNWNK